MSEDETVADPRHDQEEESDMTINRTNEPAPGTPVSDMTSAEIHAYVYASKREQAAAELKAEEFTDALEAARVNWEDYSVADKILLSIGFHSGWAARVGGAV